MRCNFRTDDFELQARDALGVKISGSGSLFDFLKTAKILTYGLNDCQHMRFPSVKAQVSGREQAIERRTG
jgi:hypothetical protein